MGKVSYSEYVLVIAEYDKPFSEGCTLSFDNYQEAFKYAYRRWRNEKSGKLKHCCYWLHSAPGWECISDFFWLIG